jgi:hypothetical protein
MSHKIIEGAPVLLIAILLLSAPLHAQPISENHEKDYSHHTI